MKVQWFLTVSELAEYVATKWGKGHLGKSCDIPCHLVTLFLPIPTSLNMKHFVKPLQRCGIQVICMSRRFATRVLF